MKKLLLLIIIVIAITVVHAQQGWYLQNSGTLKNLNSVFCVDSNKVFVAGDSGTILKTTNGGTNWNPVNSTTNEKFRAIFFADSLTGYAIGDSGTIVKTVDGGNTWNQQVSHSSSQLNSVFFTSKDTGYVVGMQATFIKTSDGGTNWKVDSTFGSCCAYLNSIKFISKSKGFCLGYDMNLGTALVSTSDTGKNWSFCFIDAVLQNAGNAMIIDSLPSEAVAVGGYILSDGGCNYLNYYAAGGGYPSTNFNSICPHRKIHNGIGSAIAVGTNGVIAIYPNNGPTDCCQLSGVTSTLNSVIFADDSLIGFIAGDSGVILKTINGGYATGIAENNLQNNFSIYPNPSNGKFQIQMDNGKLSIENYQLSIYNVLGEKVYEKLSIINSPLSINLSEAKSGIYFLQLKTSEGMATKKLVISR